MCGFFAFNSDKPQAKKLIELLEIQDQATLLRNNPGSGPASLVDIIVQSGQDRIVAPAIWWLLLDNQTLKPSRYTSFNTRSDKLNQHNSAGYIPYRHHRCIIPATAIIEGDGPKGKRRYHRIESEHCGFALGGLYRQWLNKQTGEFATSCSVITLPSHSEWQAVHSKSTPLFLPYQQPDLIAHWLDPEITDIRCFEPLMEPAFHDRLVITPIDKPSTNTPIAEAFMI